jgi:hypothetical protein
LRSEGGTRFLLVTRSARLGAFSGEIRRNLQGTIRCYRKFTIISCAWLAVYKPWKLPTIILPLDGGGLRWGWTWHISPHPRPLPQGERGIIRVFPTI